MGNWTAAAVSVMPSEERVMGPETIPSGFAWLVPSCPPPLEAPVHHNGPLFISLVLILCGGGCC